MSFQRLFLFGTLVAGALGAVLGSTEVQAGRRRGCGGDMPADEMRAVEAAFAKHKTLQALDDQLAKADPSPISIAWHVIYTNKTVDGGYLPQTAINASVSAMNNHYAPIGIKFTLDHVDYSQNSTWFSGLVYEDTTLNLEMKGALRIGNAATLNIYSVGYIASESIGELLGYATFPAWYANGTIADGVVIEHSTVPGGSNTQYNQGKTLTHETGHWLGLYHPFEGGCTGSGDFVSDTAPQSEPGYGCPIGQDSCPGGSVDNIHNFMDYGYDSCLDSFTAGQATRIREQVLYYRNATV